MTPHAFTEERKAEAATSRLCRGDLVLVYVRTGVRLRGVFVGEVQTRLFGVWADVVIGGKCRRVDRVLVREWRKRDETPTDPGILRRVGWTA